MALAEDDDVVETLAADRADQALDEGVLPGRVRRAQDLLDAHASEPEERPAAGGGRNSPGQARREFEAPTWCGKHGDQEREHAPIYKLRQRCANQRNEPIASGSDFGER
jgi:hypothetical protein